MWMPIEMISHLHHSVLCFVGQRAPLPSMSLRVYAWVSLWSVCTYVCRFAHRHALMGLHVSWTGTHSYSLQVGPPVLCPCPASGFSPLHLQLHYKPQCSTKAAPVQFPSLAPYYLLSKGSMLAAGLQSAERLQASLVLLSQKSLLDYWPLAIAERPGEYNGKTPELGCREWHRQSRWGAPLLQATSSVMKAIPSLHLGLRTTPAPISSPLPSSSPRSHLSVPQ